VLDVNVGAAGVDEVDLLPRVVRLVMETVDMPQMRQAAPDTYLIAKPNAGVPRMVKRQIVYDATPERMAELALRYVELGARIVGACCGSTPAHIAAIRESVIRDA